MIKKILLIIILFSISVKSKSCDKDEKKNPPSSQKDIEKKEEESNKNQGENDPSKSQNIEESTIKILEENFSKSGYSSFSLENLSKTDCDIVKGEIKDLDSKSLCLIKFSKLIYIKDPKLEEICTKLKEKYSKISLIWNPTQNTCSPKLSILSKN